MPTSRDDIIERITALSAENKSTRKQVLEPLVVDVRETRDLARGTNQAFEKHLEDNEEVEERVKCLEEGGVHGECQYPGIDEKVTRLDVTVRGHGRTGRRVTAVAMLLFVPIIGALVYSVRAEETMRSGIVNNSKGHKALESRFEKHVNQQKRDINAIISAIDDVPQEVAKKVNNHDKTMSDDDIEKMVQKLPTILEKRRARHLLRKIRATHE